MPPRRKPRATCAVSSTSSFGSNARITRGEKPSELVEPGCSRVAHVGEHAGERQHAIFVEVVVAQAAGQAPLVGEVLGAFAEQRELLERRTAPSEKYGVSGGALKPALGGRPTRVRNAS